MTVEKQNFRSEFFCQDFQAEVPNFIYNIFWTMNMFIFSRVCKSKKFKEFITVVNPLKYLPEKVRF